MMRRILVVLDGGASDAALLDQAAALCAGWQARLDALFVRHNAASGADFMGNAFSTYGMEAVLEALADAAAEASLRANTAFERLAGEHSEAVAGRLIEVVGLPSEAMAVEGRLSDLVVLIKPDASKGYAQMSAIEAAARESGRPVLVLPAARAAEAYFDRIVIAWDGSLEASRAVTAAMPMLHGANTVHVIHAAAESGGSDSLAGLSRYLELHGIAVSTRCVDPAGERIARALIAAAVDEGADLLVMGGFGAPGWQRALGRDETTALLKEAPFALLLTH